MSRIAVIEKQRCINGSGCPFLCQSLCPVNRTGKECIVADEDNRPKINEELCIGCAICSNRCPTECISIIKLPEEMEKTPIHQYGENGFRLYSLPVPIFGKVVGIVGRNGIGKSTAIKVIAGVLKPNLGNLQKEAGYNDLIQFFKGTEAQGFFEKVRDKKITAAYKPQQVDLIPKTQKGTVKELLKKVDEKNELKKITEELELNNLLDSDITKISGGELQRVAIAATVLKKANLYIFDEPTSYLDIKQRLKISKFIKDLADEQTAVLLVEHDLIILDYMSDLTHLMYGKEDCYGIVSLPKSVKAGINIYLSGYLKEENVRFRDKAIKFEAKPPIQKTQQNKLTSWEDIQLKLDKFSLNAEKGTIYKHDVIGILGENGIGKTSFVKILAENITPDKGKITEKVKVSFKPQYLEPDSDELVTVVLHKAIEKYTNQIINPLNIKPLLMKKLNELSGGELQRVSIALCLSQDANLYLLDEPSAYLDVEQRLITSKVIRDFMEQKGASALIVDHDILFIDYISQNLIVFDGVPGIEGHVQGPFSMGDGMNNFLRELKISMRRDQESYRPRVNKQDSVMDRKQKSENRLFYT